MILLSRVLVLLIQQVCSAMHIQLITIALEQENIQYSRVNIRAFLDSFAEIGPSMEF